MTGGTSPPLLIGEIFIDVTVTPRGTDNKMRLGGIAHAARGFWALGAPFVAAVFVPSYLERSARAYLAEFGCTNFLVLGYVSGAPNVTLIFDPTEVDDQEYDTLLRDEKTIDLVDGIRSDNLAGFTNALVFPGSYDLAALFRLLPSSLKLHVDAAYDVRSVGDLRQHGHPITTVFLSTSSPLFFQAGSSDIESLKASFEVVQPEAIVLKENRGGSRLCLYHTNDIVEIPAQLGTTVNSVGVGDVFDATYVTYRESGLVEAAWRASFASSCYAQTTDPNLFRDYVRRDSRLSLDELRGLGGTFLSWDSRPAFPIYLAAPDFEGEDTEVIERAVSALEYHNFTVRRPIKENGQLPSASDVLAMGMAYRKDVRLLEACRLVFAIPTRRDPGTLVEIGLGISLNLPVVVYDPAGECANTMVMAGSTCYGRDLDTCLNAVFTCLSQART